MENKTVQNVVSYGGAAYQTFRRITLGQYQTLMQKSLNSVQVLR